jgi:hypothetical protein
MGLFVYVLVKFCTYSVHFVTIFHQGLFLFLVNLVLWVLDISSLEYGRGVQIAFAENH